VFGGRCEQNDCYDVEVAHSAICDEVHNIKIHGAGVARPGYKPYFLHRLMSTQQIRNAGLVSCREIAERPAKNTGRTHHKFEDTLRLNVSCYIRTVKSIVAGERLICRLDHDPGAGFVDHWHYNYAKGSEILVRSTTDTGKKTEIVVQENDAAWNQSRIEAF
jgi:hypothetical protein